MAATVATPQYFTYAPGKAPAGKTAQQVKLAPGQALHYQGGKGYYAGPAVASGYRPSVPTPPPPKSPFAPSTPAAMDAAATAQAQSQLTPQQAEIQRQAQLAKDQATADEAAITGFHTAAGKLLAGIGPDIGAGITAAATEQGQLGQGFANQASVPVSDAEKAAQAYEASQGQSGGSTTDPTALHDTIYGLQGAIPGDQLASEALNARTWADAQPAIDINAGREQLDARLAQAHKDNDGYAQQLITLAATFPGLKAQALTQLNQYEIDKANYRTSLYNAQTQRKAEQANEKLAGIKTAATAATTAQEFKYKWASLAFKTQEAAAKAQQAGKTIDVGASKLVGHIVYKDGSQDTSIKVQQSTTNSPAAKAKTLRIKATAKASTDAYKVATSLYGKPVPNKAPGTLTGGKGKYMADPSAKGAGIFPPPYKNGPRTTNSLALAARTGTGAANYADARAKVYAAIGGDALIGEGLSKAQVNTIVKKALQAAGWRPGK